MQKTSISKRILSVVLCLVMALSLIPQVAFAADGDPAAEAQIGDTQFETLDAAIAAANAGDTVEVLRVDTYKLHDILKNITIDATVDGVVFDCVGTGSICSIPNGATFKNAAFEMGQQSYHGFQHAGTINMNNCTLNGLFFSYGDMNFDGCTFNQTTTEYMMWAYGGNLSYTDCKFNGNGKFINVYNEGNDGGTPWNISATGCTFNSSKANKAAFNVKETCGSTLLKFNVSVSDCTANENFPAASTDTTGKLLVLNSFVQIDDRTDDSIAAENVSINVDSQAAYPAPKPVVAQIGDVEYTSLQDALNAAVASSSDVTLEIISDIDLTGASWTPVNLSTHKSVVTINGNDHTITGLSDMLFGTAWASKGLVINDLTIKDSNIVNDENDAKGTVGVGAFVGYIDATETVTLNNCHVIDSTVNGGHWVGGFVGVCGGYNNANDGPVFTTLTITDSSVEGCTIKNNGAAGAFIGHGAMNAATKVILDGSATNNNISGEKAAKTGKLIGTIGAAGGSAAFNGEVGGIALNVVESGNTGAANVAGRIGTTGGTMIVTGGSYESDPLVTSDNSTGTIAAKEGFTIKNTDGKYVVAEKEPVAKIGDTKFETLDAAIAAANADDMVEILQAGTYKLPNISNNITVKGTVDGVVFDCVGTGSICSIPNGATFENATFNMGGNNYHGFQHAGTINFKACTLNGKFFSYGDMNFDGCTFNAPGTPESGVDGADYSMWAYGKDLTYTDCTFNCAGKCINVYCESNTVAYNITAEGCAFNSTKVNKAAFNVKETSGSNLLKYNVSVSDCSANENFPAASTDTTGKLLVLNSFVQIDDRTDASIAAENVSINVDSEAVYPLPANTLGYQAAGNGYTALPEAPEVDGDVIHVTPANAQYVLDGAYGSISGKTICFGAGSYDKLILGRPTKYDGSDTAYRHGSFAGEVLSYEDFIAYKTQAGWTEYSYYERDISNVTFTAEADAVLAGMVFEAGAHIYGTASKPVYDYVRDSGVWCTDTNNGYYLKVNISDIAFDGIHFQANGGNTLEIATSQADSVIDGVTVNNCTFTGVGTTSASGIAIRFYTDNQGENTPNVKNLTVKDTTIENYYQGIYTSGAANTTVTGCTIKNTGHNAIALQSSKYCNLGNAVVTDNTFENIGDRVIRIGMADAGSKFTITGNTATNSGDDKGEMIKDAGTKADVTYIIKDNSWDMSANILNTVAANGVTLFKTAADTYVTSSEMCVAQINDIMYPSLSDAIKAAKSGDTVTLMADLDSVGKAILPAGVTLDGNGHKLTGDSSVYINANGGTVKNVVFENIHNSVSKLSAIYADSLTGTATISGCTFTDCDWDAIQVTPLAGASVVITDNTFSDNAEDNTHQQRFVHVQSKKNVDFNATVTGNVMKGDVAQGALEVYYFADADKVDVSHNYIVDMADVCILEGNGAFVGEMVFPAYADEAKTEEYTPAAAIKSTYSMAIYATLQEAVDAVKEGEAIVLLADCSGNGVKVKSGKNFTIDFADHTYTIDGTTVGSTGTKTNGFQLLKDSSIIFKNGTLTTSKGKILIQNYANLILDNMNLVAGSAGYALSNNNGNVSICNGSVITAAPNGVAFDVCGFSDYAGANVTIDNATINGKIELSSDNGTYDLALTLNSGDFSNASIVMADGGEKVVAIKSADVVFDNIPEGCSWNCQNTLVIGIPHDLAKTEAKAVSCTLVGNKEYYTCKDCGKYFADDQATTEITANSWTIYPVGHQFGDPEIVNATCTNAGYTKYTCSVCNNSYISEVVPATGHAYTAEVTAPTCINAGYTTHTCSVCNDSYISDVVPATGHTFTPEMTSAPSCTAEGLMTYTCTCGKSYTESIDKVAHAYTAEVTAPTCINAGYTTHTCSVCNDSYISDIVPVKGHSYTSVVTDPTCVCIGYTTNTCEDCGFFYISDIVATVGHDEVVDEAVPATCTETGLSEGIHCSVCKAVIVAQEVIPAKKHTVVTDPAKPATYTESGLTEGSHCSTCHTVLVPQETDPMLKLDKPVLTSLVNGNSGITINWNAVKGATGYQIYRRIGDGEWQLYKNITDGTATQQANYPLVSGTKYQYKVVAVAGENTSAASNVRTMYYLSRPTIDIHNTTTGISVNWNAISGADGYKIYRRTNNGDWAFVQTIKGGNTISWLDADRSNGTKYQYRVAAYKTVNGVTYHSLTSLYKTRVFMSRPTITSITNTATQKIVVKWSTNVQATCYQVKYEVNGSSKTVTVEGAANVSKTISKLTKGKTYKVKVRAYKTVNGTNYYSVWSPVKSVKVVK